MPPSNGTRHRTHPRSDALRSQNKASVVLHIQKNTYAVDINKNQDRLSLSIGYLGGSTRRILNPPRKELAERSQSTGPKQWG